MSILGDGSPDNYTPHQWFLASTTMNLQEVHNLLCPFSLAEGVSAQTPQLDIEHSPSSGKNVEKKTFTQIFSWILL